MNLNTRIEYVIEAKHHEPGNWMPQVTYSHKKNAVKGYLTLCSRLTDGTQFRIVKKSFVQEIIKGPKE